MSTARPPGGRFAARAATLATVLLMAVGSRRPALAADTTPSPVTCPSGQDGGDGDPATAHRDAQDTAETQPQRHDATRRQHGAVRMRHRAADAYPRTLRGTGEHGRWTSAGRHRGRRRQARLGPGTARRQRGLYVIADMDTGQVLAAKNPHAWLLPASTIKTLTSLVVMPAVPATTKIVATDDEVNADGTRVGMVSGATYTVDDLVHGLVLMSGNDARTRSPTRTGAGTRPSRR